MSKWEYISEAPKDGTWIQAEIEGYGKDNIIAWKGGLNDSNMKDCGGWVFMTEQEPPDCWDDGVCLEVNSDGVRSKQPIKFKTIGE